MAIETFVDAAQTKTIRTPALFSLALIAATIVPFASIFLANRSTVAGSFVLLLTMLAATHVGATAYLFSDPAIRRYCVSNPIRMIAVPCVMFISALIVFSRPGPIFTACLMANFLVQTWHFGAQNIGVATFVSLADRGRPLEPIEKITIKAAIWVGMLGVLKSMSPDFTIGAEYAPLPDQAVALLSFLHSVGAALALSLAAAAVFFAARAWGQGQALYGAAVLLSITFLFPMYLTDNYMIGFTSFVIAHGLQYLVFLATHSTNRDVFRGRNSALTAPILLAIILLVANSIWVKAPWLNSTQFPTLGVGVIFAITLVHFWLDRFIWRMRDKERAGWIKTRFGCVISSRLELPA
jgi:hypothetical protein